MDIKTKSFWHLCRLKGTSVSVMAEDSLCDNGNETSKENPFADKKTEMGHKTTSNEHVGG